MNIFKFVLSALFCFLILTSCQSVSKKIDEKTLKEEKELSVWLNKSEKEYFAYMKNTNPKDNVFLWGHRMILLLKIENDQLFDNYYSIMHEKYYFNNKNLLDNTLNYIKLKKPKIIVEYDPGSILGKIPSSLYLEYQKVFSSGNINVLKRLK